jgi:hypothetical protein
VTLTTPITDGRGKRCSIGTTPESLHEGDSFHAWTLTGAISARQ